MYHRFRCVSPECLIDKIAPSPRILDNWRMQTLTIIQKIAVWVIPMLFAITVHEVAHGWVADKLGDPTAKMLGRLTLNPIKHIDLFGTIIMPLGLLLLSGFRFAFGFAKPVPVTWQNLKNPRRDMALVALAGPAANLLMALLWALFAKAGMMMNPQANTFALVLVLMGQAGIVINLLLMIFNLIPIPPLDGSRVLSAFLPPKASYYLDRIEPYGIIVMLVLLVSGALQFFVFPLVMIGLRLIANLFGL